MRYFKTFYTVCLDNKIYNNILLTFNTKNNFVSKQFIIKGLEQKYPKMTSLKLNESVEIDQQEYNVMIQLPEVKI